jgi:hypothetical protein
MIRSSRKRMTPAPYLGNQLSSCSAAHPKTNAGRANRRSPLSILYFLNFLYILYFLTQKQNCHSERSEESVSL